MSCFLQFFFFLLFGFWCFVFGVFFLKISFVVYFLIFGVLFLEFFFNNEVLGVFLNFW